MKLYKWQVPMAAVVVVACTTAIGLADNFSKTQTYTLHPPAGSSYQGASGSVSVYFQGPTYGYGNYYKRYKYYIVHLSCQVSGLPAGPYGLYPSGDLWPWVPVGVGTNGNGGYVDTGYQDIEASKPLFPAYFYLVRFDTGEVVLTSQ